MNLYDVIQYAEDCISDEILSCQKHKWACERFLNDYENTLTGLSEYYFNWNEVEKFLKWASFFKHTKGVLAGKPIVLDIYQVFVITNIYGFYNAKNNYRRFQKVYLQVARKNAKSQLLTLINTYELMVFPRGSQSEVYCAATKRNQAKIVYDEMVRILKKNKDLKGKWKNTYGKITHLKSDSFCTSLSKDDGKTGDGLNVQCACIDEYHAYPTSEILDILDSGAGARTEPLIVIITTAGFNLNHPCYTVEYKLVSRILNPEDEINLDTYFCDVFELETNNTSETIETEDRRKIGPGELIDDPFDEKNWPKANPIICTYESGYKYIKNKSLEAKAAPEKKKNFLTKHLDVWVNQRDCGYMPVSRWNACECELPDLKGMSCYVGLDLSSKLDLTGVGFVIPYKNKYIVMGHAFMPENKFHEKMQDDKVPYDLWEEAGYLTTTPGDVIDYEYVMNWFIAKSKEIGLVIEEVCVDPWSAAKLTNDLTNMGLIVVDIIQGIKTLSEPTKDFRDQVYNKNIMHDGNKLIAWSIGNSVVDIKDQNLNILLNKKKSIERIDQLAAILNAFVRARVEKKVSVYDQRGIISLS